MSLLVLANGAMGLGGLGDGLFFLLMLLIGGGLGVLALIAFFINATSRATERRHLRVGAVIAGLPAFLFASLMLLAADAFEISESMALFQLGVGAVGLLCLLMVVRAMPDARARPAKPPVTA